jgi:hypothetical protein
LLAVAVEVDGIMVVEVVLVVIEPALLALHREVLHIQSPSVAEQVVAVVVEVAQAAIAHFLLQLPMGAAVVVVTHNLVATLVLALLNQEGLVEVEAVAGMVAVVAVLVLLAKATMAEPALEVALVIPIVVGEAAAPELLVQMVGAV